MKGFDVLKVKSAVKARNSIDLSYSHLTTMNFGEINCLMHKEMIPGGDSFEISPHYFSRLVPLVKPTYGKCMFKTVSAYVPYHMVAADAEAYISGKTVWEGWTTNIRHFTLYILHTFIKLYCITTTGANSTNTVYNYLDSSGTLVYNVFNKFGKYVCKVLTQLGYSLPSNVDEQSTSYWTTTLSAKKLSALPLLAFFKLYNDYMSQSQRFNVSPLTEFLNNIKYRHPQVANWNEATGAINATGLFVLFNNLKLCYENDYFTSAWQSANNPLAYQEQITGVEVPGQLSAFRLNSSISNDYINVPVSSSQVSITQRALDFLRTFDTWVRRNNYSGSRSVQQVYSRFGIKTSDYREHYSHILSVDEFPIQIGDVTATGSQFISAGDPNNVGLGDYSGKGIMNGNHSVKFEADDYGQAFILGFFTVTPMNSFGFDREVLRVEPLDFYTPEFDGLGADAISVGEYYSDPLNPASTIYDDNVFGYTERYNSYRYSRDYITGEFRNYHSDGDMNCWHTGRNLSSVRANGNLVAQNSAVNTMPQTDSEYNRIFANTSGDIDHFYVTCEFNLNAVRPIMNRNQVVNLGEGETNVPRNGNVIS